MSKHYKGSKKNYHRMQPMRTAGGDRPLIDVHVDPKNGTFHKGYFAFCQGHRRIGITVVRASWFVRKSGGAPFPVFKKRNIKLALKDPRLQAACHEDIQKEIKRKNR